jgi:hypothetical protein
MKILTSLKRSFKGPKKTSFPSLDAEHCPELIDVSSESSTDEDAIEQKRRTFATKEDEDVQVFLGISQKLSLKSLIFLLQNHAKLLNIPEATLNAALQRKVATPTVKPMPKKKTFRFAKVANDQVRTIVYPIPRDDDMSHWWSPQESGEIRLDAARIVQFYKKHEPGFLSTIETISDSAQQVDREHISVLQNHQCTRGLESHMCDFLGGSRKLVIRAVLDEQARCEVTSMPARVIMQNLRTISMAKSYRNRVYAARMAEFDHVEALKASLSRWRVSQK